MRRTTLLQGSAVLLIALTVWALGLILMTLLGLPTLSLGGGSALGGEGSTVREVLAANRLRLASGEEIRLAAIEVPSVGQPFAEEGKQATRALTQGKEIRIEGTKEAAYVYLPDGNLLQALLLSGGYARLGRELPEGELAATLQAAQGAARDQGLGIWEGGPPAITEATLVPTPAPVSCDPNLIAEANAIAPHEAADHMDEEVTVVLYPLRSESTNGNLTLLSGMTKDEFGIYFPAALATSHEDLAALYLGRCVAVSGRIERGIAGAGPRIVVRALHKIIILR